MTQNPAERDDAWFESLFRANATRVWAYAARRVSDPDDVVAEVFATAWNHRARLPDPPLGWLLRTAHHHVEHAHRSTARHTRLADRAAHTTDLTVPDPADTITDRLDARQQVSAALDQLRSTDRELLTLSAWDQLDPGELAEVLGCSPIAARVRLHRARRRLYAVLTRLQQVDPAGSHPATTSEATS